ncbi:MAG: hypothetical protein ABSF48_05970 [Thermodesulfobacteriota bacterium]|jgi:hypothetical protein
MWIRKSDRKSLIEVLSGNGAAGIQGCHPSDSIPTEPLSGDDIYLIWDHDPRVRIHLPIQIIVGKGHLRDFLAWVSTYFPDYRPFTGYFRVLDFETLTNLRKWGESPSLEGVEAGCIGLIIGEALTLLPDLGGRVSLTTIACSSTISYSFARALALGAMPNQLDLVREKWSLARKLTEQAPRKLEIGYVEDIWNVVAYLQLKGGQVLVIPKIPGVILEACLQLKEKGEISDRTWVELTANNEELRAAQEKMRATREERVLYFQRLLSSDAFSKLHEASIQSFVPGYLASLIGPGTMSHINLVSPHLHQLQTILLWYGLCAGLHRKNELLSSFNVLGRRLLRELLRAEPLLGRPSTDIAVSELEVLLEGNGKSIGFRTFSPNYVLVELLPCISTYLSFPKRDAIRQEELFPKPLSAELLSKLGLLLEKAVEVQRLLTGPMAPPRDLDHDSYNKGKKRGKKSQPKEF